MKNFLKYFPLVILAVFTACKHDETITDPTLNDTFSPFSYVENLTVSKSVVGFGLGETVSFYAKFSIKTHWKISIRGYKTGSIATITGSSNTLNEKIAMWDGRSDVPVFPADSAIATLSFPDDTTRTKQTVSLKVTSSKNIKSNPNYIVVKDFSKGMTGVSFNPDGKDIDSSGIITVAGAICFSAAGAERGTSTYYMGGLAITPAAESPNAKYFPVVPSGTVADSAAVNNTWFNIWVYGTGSTSTKMNIQFKESDLGNIPFQYQDPKDDAWEYAVYPVWNGWQQISFPMNKTTISVSPAYGGSGNKIREIDRIVIIGINIGTIGNAAAPAQTIYTYPVFSIGGPFNY